VLGFATVFFLLLLCLEDPPPLPDVYPIPEELLAVRLDVVLLMREELASFVAIVFAIEPEAIAGETFSLCDPLVAKAVVPCAPMLVAADSPSLGPCESMAANGAEWTEFDPNDRMSAARNTTRPTSATRVSISRTLNSPG
jgi:hypothetical protein